MFGPSDRVPSNAKSFLRADLVKKGLRNPRQVPPFLLGQLFPNSNWAPNWRREDGYVMFEDGGFAGGSPSRPELSARIYREVQQLREVLADTQYERSLEIGSGYGRLSGWIADHADEAVGVDPNEEAIKIARTMYPEITFHVMGAEDLPFPDDHFDLFVSWSVLQHVPPESIGGVAAEVRRVLTDDATVVLCEKTRGDPGRTSWVRSTAEYESLFAPCELRTRAKRPGEPTFEYSEYSETMVLNTTATPPPGASKDRRTASID